MEASHSLASVTVLVFAGEDTSSHPNGGGGCHDGLGEVPRQNRGGANPPKPQQLAFKLALEVENTPRC